MCLSKLLYIVMLCKEFLYIGIKKTVGVLLIKHQKRKRNIVDRKTNRRRSSSQTNGFELLSNSPASMRFAFSVSRCIRRGFHGLLPMVARTWDWKSHGSHPFAPKMTWSLKYHGMLRLHSDGATGKTSNFPTIEQLLMRTTFCISLDPLFYPTKRILSFYYSSSLFLPYELGTIPRLALYLPAHHMW